MDVLKLLRSKNRCLEKFLRYSQEFLTYAEGGDLSTLQYFQSRRDATLKALQLYDRKISEMVAQLSPSERTTSLIESVRQTLELKGKLIQSILATDQKIISKIEDEKKRILQELSSSDRNKQLVRKFKSGWIAEAGEKLDGKI